METSIVADEYRAIRDNGKYSKSNGSKLLRKGVKITVDIFESVNSETELNGRYFVKDEDATKERNSILEAKLKGEVLVKKSDTPNSELDELRAKYKELSGEDSSKTWGVKKLTSEIELLSKKD